MSEAKRFITRYSRDFQGNLQEDPNGSWVLAADAAIRDKRMTDKIDQLQQRLTTADDKNDTLSIAYLRAGEREHELRLRVHQLGNLLTRWADLLGVSAPGLRDETLDALKPADGAATTTCTWSSYEFSWASSCGMTDWEFTDGGTPDENGMKFCHCCGKTLVVEVPDPCACIGCEASKVSGSLFCAAHQSAKSRTRAQNPLTAEGLEWMMQNDGYQQ